MGLGQPRDGEQYAIYGCYYIRRTSRSSATSPARPASRRWAPRRSGPAAGGRSTSAGNVWERTLDAFAGYVDPCVDCAYLAAGSTRVVRGGCFISATTDLAPTTRFELQPAIRNNYVGFRCARAP